MRAALIFAALTAPAAARAETAPDAASQERSPWSLPLDLVDADETGIEQRVADLTGPRRRQVIHWLAEAGSLRPHLETWLSEAGAPPDLVWLVALESGFEPTARSRAGAAGLWQLMPDTADHLGLRRDREVDERLDPRASTLAAGRLLASLQRRFGSWRLALVAYNIGPMALQRRLAGRRETSWVALVEAGAIPVSAARYADQFMALALVAQNPAAFGLEGVVARPTVRWVTIDVPAGEPLRRFAQAAGIDVAELRQMNPHLLLARTPTSESGRWPLTLTPDVAAKLDQRLGEVATEAVRDDRIWFGESVDEAAQRLGTTASVLRRLNGWVAGQRVEYGTAMVVPLDARTTWEPLPGPVATPPVQQPPGATRWFYRAHRGDLPATVAAWFSVPVDAFCGWNGLDPRIELRPGTWVELWLTADPPPMTRVARAREAGPPASRSTGSPAARLSHVVAAGDTLGALARRYRVSVGDLRRWNGLGANEPIVVGSRLWVAADRR